MMRERCLQAVDVVAQAGKPKSITGFQTHTTPVLLAYGERAELANDECQSLRLSIQFKYFNNCSSCRHRVDSLFGRLGDIEAESRLRSTRYGQQISGQKVNNGDKCVG